MYQGHIQGYVFAWRAKFQGQILGYSRSNSGFARRDKFQGQILCYFARKAKFQNFAQLSEDQLSHSVWYSFYANLLHSLIMWSFHIYHHTTYTFIFALS